MSKPKLGIAGDFVGSGTGFAEVLLNLANNLKDKYQISQLATGYSGDYSPHQKDINLYTCGGKDDPFGIKKICNYIEREELDLLMVLNDPWLADRIIMRVREKFPTLPVLLYTPVDSEGLNSAYVKTLNMYDHVVAYTEFGRKQLQQTGLEKPCTIIPHGVDTETFKPIDRKWAREMLGIQDKHGFIIGYCAQNQPRKKVDHFIWIISEWLKKYPHEDVAYYYHGPIARQFGLNVKWYIEYLDSKNPELNLPDRFIYTDDSPNFIASRELLHAIFGIFDVFLHTSPNEGWGMTPHQSMAMGIPTIVPNHSALSEWTIDENGPGVFYIPVLDIPNIYESGINTDHKVIDPKCAVEALEYLYRSEQARKDFGQRGYEVATQDKFLWPNIALEFDKLFQDLLSRKG